MAANQNPIFTLTPNVKGAKATVANTSLAPTYNTNTYDAFVAGANGSTIENIHVKALETSIAGLVRIWLYDGTTMFLWHEIPVTAITQSTSVATWEADWQPPNTLWVLPTTWKVVITVTTLTATGFAVTCTGGDF